MAWVVSQGLHLKHFLTCFHLNHFCRSCLLANFPYVPNMFCHSSSHCWDIRVRHYWEEVSCWRVSDQRNWNQSVYTSQVESKTINNLIKSFCYCFWRNAQSKEEGGGELPKMEGQNLQWGSLLDEVILFSISFSWKPNFAIKPRGFHIFSKPRSIERRAGLKSKLQVYSTALSSPSRCSWWGSGRRRCPRYRFQTGRREEGCCCGSAGRPWNTRS